MSRQFGLILEAPDPKAWNFGAGNAVYEVLVPDGQWDEYLPSEELQNNGYFEPYACATFGTFNAIETLLRRRYSQIENYADRFTAKATKTDIKMGNDPHYVAEYIRAWGGVYEKDYPATNVRTFEEYYAELPNLPDVLTPQFTFQHEYVPKTPEAMKDALRFSPLGVSVYGWAINEAGYYYKPEGYRDNHWCMCFGYVDGQYWKIFDSYSNSVKKVAWNTPFEVVKRYHVKRTERSHEQLSTLSLWLKNILFQLRAIIKI